MSASGLYGDVRACAGIVGHVDLRLGAVAEDVLRSHIAAGHGRFRGIRHSASHHERCRRCWGRLPGACRPGSIATRNSAKASRCCTSWGSRFDAWLLEPQLPDLIDLARAFPETTIVLDHVGTPLGVGVHAGKRDERFDIWRDNIRELAKCQNVNVKLGGLAMPFGGFEWSYACGRALPPTWPRRGSPISTPASRRSGRTAPCSKAISRSTATPATTPCCGTR